jgi:CDP-glucose 4,6-dehydratase
MSTFWNERNAFVTGATGFVGANVVKMLVEQGAGVVCLQRDSVKANTLDLFDLRRHVTVISGSVEDYALMQRIINEYGIDAVFHLAAQAIVGPANRSPFSTLETNIRGTYALLEACRISPTVKRVVVASSDKAYGTHKELPYTEDYSLQGLFPYDASKACGDMLARSFAHTFNTPIAVTRFANIYGSSRRCGVCRRSSAAMGPRSANSSMSTMPRGATSCSPKESKPPPARLSTSARGNQFRYWIWSTE